MAQWRIKEISDLTKISVRTLHHYDKIGLLKSSMRESNGYRWYSEGDLAKLQQIIALKFFGFSLGQIKTMLQQELSINEHLTAQKEMLAEQAEHLQQAQDAIDTVLEQNKTTKSLDWNTLITLIGRYRMTQELKKTWVGKLTKNQQASYIELKQEYPKEFEAWEKAIETINSMTLGDPEGPEGERIINLFIDITKKTKESMDRQRKLNSDILRSIKEGSVTELPLSPEGNMWLAKASLAYYLKRWEQIYQDITKNLNTDPKSSMGKKIAQRWRELVNEQFIGTPPELAIGAMIWQETAQQMDELQKHPAPLSVQEQVKQVHVELFFNPEALSWIEEALSIKSNLIPNSRSLS